MLRLVEIMSNTQDWLEQRCLEYVARRNAAPDDGSRVQPWRELVSTLSAEVIGVLEAGNVLPDWASSDDPTRDPVAAAGVPLGRAYRAWGIPLSLPLGVLNAYHDACAELIAGDATLPPRERDAGRAVLRGVLDRMEAGVCAGWTDGEFAGSSGAPVDELFRAVLDAVPDILLVKDRNSVFLGVSERYTDLMGRSKESILGGTDFDIFPRPDAIRYKAEEVGVMKSGEPVVAEHLLETSHGPRWFEAIKSPLRSRSGEVIGVLSTERDITERKNLEAEISEQRRFLKTILDTLTDAVVFKDRDSRIVLCNHAVKAFFGKSEADMIGKTDFDLLPERIAQCFRDEDLDVISSGRTIRSQHSMEFPDGMHWDESIRTPLRDERGGTVGVLVTIRDVTEQVKARLALQVSEAYVKTILESMPVGTLVIDVETRTVVDVNSAALELLGRAREELVGEQCHDQICGVGVDGCPIGLGHHTGYHGQAVLRRADGTTLPVLKTVAAITLQGRQVFLESIVDITEQ